MSRTYHHTTPAFPRSLRGPRGGQIVAPTPCADCVAFDCCRPGACSAPFGCDSWVDYDGRRVDVEADNARLLAAIAAHDLEPVESRPHFDEDARPVDLAAALDDHMDAAFRAPDDDPTPCEGCQGLPSECRPCGCPHVEPDPGPLFQR